MIRTLFCTTALMIAAPAIAQDAAPAQQAPDAASMPAQQAPAPAQDPAAAQGAATAQAQPAPATDVASIVDTEFPAYDADKSGQLEKAEFGKWMVALKDQEMKTTGQSLPPAQVTAWADGAFTTADKDKSTAVTKEELVKFLTGGA
ncbi:EF-hand domain-containing protein [Sphingobium sp. H39-3-25]|uniref:EF-hand domain-containing protein n=1 Tax=Sphingobium arseniciresistens TaxID=3030834 RepID=UPI0023B9C135|nr:EF-hand domain-containing protein [Sphingobium arseniciresistens]